MPNYDMSYFVQLRCRMAEVIGVLPLENLSHSLFCFLS